MCMYVYIYTYICVCVCVYTSTCLLHSKHGRHFFSRRTPLHRCPHASTWSHEACVCVFVCVCVGVFEPIHARLPYYTLGYTTPHRTALHVRTCRSCTHSLAHHNTPHHITLHYTSLNRTTRTFRSCTHSSAQHTLSTKPVWSAPGRRFCAGLGRRVTCVCVCVCKCAIV
jgi:hypothetical protein